MPAKWITHLDDTDLLESRKVGPRAYQFINVVDMVDACGRDATDEFVAELHYVDLDAIDADTIRKALECCGQQDEPDLSDLAIAECCHSYGAKAPLDSWSGNGRTVVRRQARSEAHSLLTSGMKAALQRPVNQLGSTAAEFMRGDIFSAMQRGAEAGDPSARLMAKVYGVDQHIIDDARPADFLPFVMGYMAGMQGEPMMTGKGLSPEVARGHQRGERVRKGECPAPSWIKTHNAS